MQPRFEAMGVWIKHWMNGLETELLEYQGVKESPYVDAIDALSGAIRLSSCPDPPTETVKTEETMEDILKQLREARGFNLPFKEQLTTMSAPIDET